MPTPAFEVAAATDALLTTARSLAPDSVALPSLCSGWTRGHILTHIARNADGIGNLVTWATTSARTPMYASAESREADIEAGSTRTLAELVADVESSAAHLAGRLASLRPEHDTVTLRLRNGRELTASQIPALRLRELVFHHVDLDAGFGFADIDPQLQAGYLAGAVGALEDNPDAPSLDLVTADGDRYHVGAADRPQVVSGTRAQLLTWLAREVDLGLKSDRPLPRLPFGG
jgi:maleylpyruvate isomerase